MNKILQWTFDDNFPKVPNDIFFKKNIHTQQKAITSGINFSDFFKVKNTHTRKIMIGG